MSARLDPEIRDWILRDLSTVPWGTLRGARPGESAAAVPDLLTALVTKTAEPADYRRILRLVSDEIVHDGMYAEAAPYVVPYLARWIMVEPAESARAAALGLLEALAELEPETDPAGPDWLAEQHVMLAALADAREALTDVAQTSEPANARMAQDLVTRISGIAGRITDTGTVARATADDTGMTFDLDAAVAFVATHGRLLDRRRLELLLGGGSGEAVLAALDGYRNGDGGYGWGLEPDHRSVTSQPVAAMHALEVLAELPDAGTRPVELCDWLARHTGADGGVPFGLPFTDTEGCAPHWVAADPAASSLQMTAQLAAQAYRVARRRRDVAGHLWLSRASAYCLDAIERLPGEPHAYEVMFALRFLDEVGDQPRARALIERLVAYVVPDGLTPVAGGAPGEGLHLLDFTPYPGTPVRAAFDPAAVAADLDRLAADQQADGGWTVGFPSYSPAAELEWRAYATVQALVTLGATG